MSDQQNPSTIPSTAITTLTLEALDFTPGCAWEHPDQTLCGADATWLGIFPCCDHSFQVCDLHQVGGEVAMAVGNSHHIRCGNPIPEMVWLSLD